MSTHTFGAFNLHNPPVVLFDRAIEDAYVHNTYEQRVLATGAAVMTRQDRQAITITVNGYWQDDASHEFHHDFKDALYGLGAQSCVLDAGMSFNSAVVDAINESLVAVVGFNSGTPLKFYRWTMRVKVLSGARL